MGMSNLTQSSQLLLGLHDSQNYRLLLGAHNSQKYGLEYGNKNYINFDELNIYAYNNKENFDIIKESFKNFPEYKLNFHYMEDLKSINKDIDKKFNEQTLQKQNCYNIILVILNEDKNIEEEKKNISDCLVWEYSFIRPIIILIKKKNIENKKQTINNNNQKKNKKNQEIHRSKNLRNPDISNEYIFVYYKDTTFTEIIEKIKQLYRYFNNIGDIYTIINDILGQPEKCINENDVKNQYRPTINILVIGRSGGGKSTLINLLLNKKKALTEKKLFGSSKTKLFSRYIHQKSPITFIDTPGIENEEDFIKMKKYLGETKKLFGDGKNKIHIILYIINSCEPRDFNSKEISLIFFIDKKMKIPIFFVCTRAENKKHAMNRKEFIKVNLKQNFGENTNLEKYIYLCQLLDEKDGIYKSFGIYELLDGINEFFKEDKKYLEYLKINLNQSLYNQNFNQFIPFSFPPYAYLQSYNQNNINFNQKYNQIDYSSFSYSQNFGFFNNNCNQNYNNQNLCFQNNINQNLCFQNNINQNLCFQNNINQNICDQNINKFDQNLIFLSSLKTYNYNFQNYLKTFCDNIINYYKNYFKEIASNGESSGNDLRNIKKKTIKMLIKHLAYELNGDLSNNEIKNIIDCKEIEKVDNDVKNIIDCEEIEKAGYKAKDIFLTNPNDYFNNLIDGYIEAINSLKDLYKEK